MRAYAKREWIAHLSLGFVTLLSAGCSRVDCVKTLAKAVNQENTHSAVLTLDECRGATVGYVTDLRMERLSRNRSVESRNVWSVKGSVQAELQWIAPARLEVRYPATVEHDSVVQEVSHWAGVEIVYKVREK